VCRKREKSRPGPDADHLVIDRDWEDAVQRSLRVERPKDGWPTKSGEKGESQSDAPEGEDPESS